MDDVPIRTISKCAEEHLELEVDIDKADLNCYISLLETGKIVHTARCGKGTNKIPIADLKSGFYKCTVLHEDQAHTIHFQKC